jgi:hypothetical protein
VGVALLVGVIWWAISGQQSPTANSPTALRPPAQVRANLREDGQIELTWDQPSERLGLTGFKIERAINGLIFSDEALARATAEATSYLDTPPAPGTPCYYRLYSTGTGGDSAYSPIVSAPPNFGNGFLPPTGSNLPVPPGLAYNGGAGVVNGVLRLTDNKNQTRSAFYRTLVDVRSFTTTFTFRIGGGEQTADGFTFCIQGNDPGQVGGGNGGLGYEGIPKSVAVKFDLYNNSGEGTNSTGLFLNGAGPYQQNSIDLTPSGISLHSGRPYRVELTYESGNLTLKIADVDDEKKALTRTLPVDIRRVVRGRWAYAGFTAAAGGNGAVQEVLNWTWKQGEVP